MRKKKHVKTKMYVKTNTIATCEGEIRCETLKYLKKYKNANTTAIPACEDETRSENET